MMERTITPIQLKCLKLIICQMGGFQVCNFQELQKRIRAKVSIKGLISWYRPTKSIIVLDLR